jgi:ferritin-like protein
MSHEGFHVPVQKLKRKTIHLHYAIESLMEELEAVDWYRQRMDDTDDESLKAILNHNANEETEHAAMLLEWLRRNDDGFDKQLRTYLFSTKPILEVEEEAEHHGD